MDVIAVDEEMEVMPGNWSNSTATNSVLQYIRQMEMSGQFEDKWRNVILITTYSLIVIVSLIGNLLVCKVILEKRRHVATTTNILIANLAVSDLMMTVLNIPFNIARFVLDNWPFGEALCVLVPFTQSVSVHCSSITMMFIAIERYRSVLYNRHMSGHCHRKYCVPFNGLLVIIWCTSALFSIPHGIYNRVIDINDLKRLIRCQVVYPEPRQQFRQALTVISFGTQYAIPMLLTAVCYARIAVFLWRRKIVGSVPEGQRLSIIRRKRRRINMLMTVVVMFAICWLPLNLFHILTDFYVIHYNPSVFFINHWFAMSSVCYNPFIYCWLNKTFRRKLRNLLQCKSQSLATNSHHMNATVNSMQTNSMLRCEDSFDGLELQSIQLNHSSTNNTPDGCPMDKTLMNA